MEFLNRLLNRPSPKPAICSDSSKSSSPKRRRHDESAGEVVPRPLAGPQDSNEYETANSSSGPSSIAQESLSSASSFQSLASSVGSKSSSGICADSAPTSPEHHLQGSESPALDATVIVGSENSFDNSYVNVNIPDLDDLVSLCAKIDLGESHRIEDEPEVTFDNCTFESAADDTTLVITHSPTKALGGSFSSSKTFNQNSPDPGPIQFPVFTEVKDNFSSSEEVFKVPLPVNPLKSVVPHVPIESTISKQNSETDELFKSALNSFSEQPDRKYSPTPFVEDDVVEAARDKLITENPNSTFDVQEGEEEKAEVEAEAEAEAEDEEEGTKTPVVEADNTDNNVQLNTFPSIPLNSSDVTFEEVEAFNSTNNLKSPLSPITERDSQQSFELSPKLVEKSDSTSLNKTEIVENNFKVKSLNKTEIIENSSENKSLNKIETIESNSENKSLNKTESIENNSEIKKENSLVEDKSLKEQINNSLIQEAKIPHENVLNKTNTLNQTKSPKKADALQEDILSPKSASLKIVTPEKEDSNIDQELETPEQVDDNDLDAPTQKEVISPIKKDYQEIISNNKKLTDVINFEVTSSTPLPKKDLCKNDSPKNPKKNNLFSSEANSESQSPQPLKSIPAVDFNNKQNKVNFDETVSVNKTFEKSSFDEGASELITKDNFEVTDAVDDNSVNNLQEKDPEEYEAFKPQQQSTKLPPTNVNFEKLQEAALDVAKDIDSSIEKFEDGEHFISANAELFEDPAAFDFLTQAGSQPPGSRGDRYDSLFMKFDPLAQRLSMLPQKNSISMSNAPAEVEEAKQETEQEIPVDTTPKKNPAIAAIDRLLFESPSVENFNSTVPDEAKVKLKRETEKPQSPLVSFVDEKMVKELELVRSSVLQLEEELDKQKQEHKKELEKQKQEYKQQLEKIKENCEDKICNVQTKLTDEIKCKDQMTVVVEEYEKSISRLIADREKDKSSLEVEKARLQEELDLANQHLSNTEAAFSDVHSKYERLKKSVAAYRSNEAVLKESIAENQDTIKTLENRYEQLKSHAMAQLEKANMELEAIRKQHEAEAVKLKALLRKAELKGKSLEETVEQKMKENKELTKIIDEMIARVN